MALRVALLVGVLLALGAASAGAATSPGLYEPFPTPVANSQTQHYFGELHVKRSNRQLARGAFSRGLVPSDSLAASLRAGVGAGPAGLAPLIVVGLLALGLAGAAALRRGR